MNIQVCRSCERSEPVIAAANEIKKRYGTRVTIEIVECLDQCHYPPAVSVNDQLMIWADAIKLRTVVARLMNNEE